MQDKRMKAICLCNFIVLGLTFVLPAQQHLRHPSRHIQQQELVLV